MAKQHRFTSGWKTLVAGIALAIGSASSAQADDALCVVTALAFDDNLNPLGILETAERTFQAVNPVRECARDKGTSFAAAEAACRKSPEAHFVLIARRADGVDLINSRDSKTRFRDQLPDRDKATIKMRSCEYWFGQAQSQ